MQAYYCKSRIFVSKNQTAEERKMFGNFSFCNNVAKRRKFASAKAQSIKRMRKIWEKHSHLLHKFGISLSFLCAIHCIATPILLTLAPLAGNFLSETTEQLLLFVGLGIGLYVLIKDYFHHEQVLPLLLLALSGILIISSMLGLGHILQTTASLIMALAYFLNWRYHRKVCHTHSH